MVVSTRREVTVSGACEQPHHARSHPTKRKMASRFCGTLPRHATPSPTRSFSGATMLDIPAVVVFGEVILDLIAGPSGAHTPHTGGSPFNVALALARQDVPVRLLSPLSDDPIGDRFARRLTEAGGTLGGGRSARPTSVALVWIDANGQPDYALYRDGIADLDTTPEALQHATPAGTRLVHTGALTLTPEAVHLVHPWMQWLRTQGVTVSIDVNFRPKASRDLAAYIATVERTWPLCNMAKMSDEDLAGMGRSGPLDQEAARVMDQLPAHTGLVVITQGARGAYLLNRRGSAWVSAITPTRVVDTVGAGDCFQAGLLTALLERDLLRDQRFAFVNAETLRQLGQQAAHTAVLNVERAGCQPPMRAEVQRGMEAPLTPAEPS